MSSSIVCLSCHTLPYAGTWWYAPVIAGQRLRLEMPSRDPAFILTPSNATYNCYQNKLFKHKYPSSILKIVKWLPNCLPNPLRFKALLISQASSCHTLQLTNWGRTGNALDLHQLTPAHA